MPDPPADSAGFSWPAATFWVIDDDSVDRIADIVAERARRDARVRLIRRRMPEARTGKGDALNAGTGGCARRRVRTPTGTG